MIRNRAKQMTTRGHAASFLASLLGYLDADNKREFDANRKVLVAKDGFYLHCLGHSFGGRFLTAAIKDAYGVPHDLHDKIWFRNRWAWNQYFAFAANLDDETRARLVKEKGYCEKELKPFSPEELQGVEEAFAKRKDPAKNIALPASGAEIDFSHVQFDEKTYFSHHIFTECRFTGANFSDRADFQNSIFSKGVNFACVNFRDKASFIRAIFSSYVDFEHATFSQMAEFESATFFGGALFEGGVTFVGNVSFRSAAFFNEARFDGAIFEREANSPMPR